MAWPLVETLFLRFPLGGQPGGAGRRRLSMDFFDVGPQIIGTSPSQIILRGPGVMVAYIYCNINVCSVSLLNIFTELTENN